MKTIKSVAQEMYDNLEMKTRDNGEKFICTKETIYWQRDIIHNAHLDRLPNDDIYDRIQTILEAFTYLDNDADQHEAQEVIYDIEPDIYTHDLTKWLHDHNANIGYLDQAMESSCDSSTDATYLLMDAQKLYIEDIGDKVLQGIIDYIEESEV